MKRKLTLYDKLRIFKMWMKEHGNALIESCLYCKSTKVRRVDYTEQDSIYKAKYECLECKATADVAENWQLPKATKTTESA